MIKKRLTSIDMLRGLVMVIMALDHVRDMLGRAQPADLAFSDADAALFFTRWITHFCAPTFILLAGIGVFLYEAKKKCTKRELSRYLLTRGIWLIFVEFTIINLGWNFNVGTQFAPLLQIFWVIGWSMLTLAGLIWLPRPVILGFALVMILGHNLLDIIEPVTEQASALWVLFHIQAVVKVGGSPIAYGVYPLIPWIAVLALGYGIGPLFSGENPSRPRTLLKAGALLTGAFFVFRLLNLYGDPNTWHTHDTLAGTLVDFFDVTKYPASLHYLLMTLGPVLMLLGAFERTQGRVADALTTIGRVPFFYYVVHIYLIHALAFVVALIQGIPLGKVAVLFIYYPANFGIGLGLVYLVWIAVVLTLYPVCHWFAGVKRQKHVWWLSYL